MLPCDTITTSKQYKRLNICVKHRPVNTDLIHYLMSSHLAAPTPREQLKKNFKSMSGKNFYRKLLFMITDPFFVTFIAMTFNESFCVLWFCAVLCASGILEFTLFVDQSVDVRTFSVHMSSSCDFSIFCIQKLNKKAERC